MTPVIYSDFGPFWFRGYYTADKTGMLQTIDSTLLGFDVKHIFTGHTIVADTVSVWYHGKVINVDLHHAKGISEAVLIERKNYYRVNARGGKFLLKVK